MRVQLLRPACRWESPPVLFARNTDSGEISVVSIIRGEQKLAVRKKKIFYFPTSLRERELPAAGMDCLILGLDDI